MKKAITIITLLILVLPLVASAQSDSRTEARERFRLHLDGQRPLVEVGTRPGTGTPSDNVELRARLQADDPEKSERFRSRKERLLENRSEIKARLGVEAKGNVDRLIENILSRFNRILERFEGASDKISDHIERLEGNGIDVTEIVRLFEEAEAQLEVTKEIMADAEVELQAELDNEEVSRDTIKAIVETVKESVRETRSAYVEVITALKASSTEE